MALEQATEPSEARRRTQVRVLWKRLALCVAACALGMSGATASAQQEALPAIADSPTAQTLMGDLLAQSADNPAEAARLARRLLDEYGARVVRVGGETDGLFASVADETERLLLAQPRVLERFRDNESRAAERMLEEEGASATAARRRLTRAGLVASLALAERALRTDRPAETRAILARVARHPDLSGRERIAHAALEGAAARRLGIDASGAIATLEQIVRNADLAPTELDEARAALAQVKRTAPATDAKPVRSPLTPGGSTEIPDSSWREIWSMDLDGTLFRRLFDGPVAAMSPRIVERARNEATWMSTCPTVVGRTVFISEGQRVRAIDADSREERWSRTLGAVGVERDVSGIGDLSAIAADEGALALFEGHAFANSRSGPARVWCLDPRTGDPLWVVELDRHEGRPEFESLFPVGAPVLLPDLVILAARKSTQRLEQVDWLIALDRRDGSVRWATSVAGAPGTRVIASRRQAGLALDDDAVVVDTPLGATARVRTADGAIEWLRRVTVPLRDSRLAAEAWEVSPPVVVGGKVFTISTDATAVEALDRTTGRLVDTKPLGPETAWGDPRYLVAGSTPLAGSGTATPVVLAVGSDIVAFSTQDLSKPIWRFSDAVRAFSPARLGADNRSGIRGRVSVAGSCVVVPGVDELVILDLAGGAVLARIAGQKPANAVLVDDRIVAAGDDSLRVLMPPQRAESILRARLAATPDDPGAALALLELARATGRPALALEAARAAEAAIVRGFGAEAQREALIDQLIAIAENSPEHGAEAHDAAARIALSPRLKVRTMLAHGDFFRINGRVREAIEVWNRLACDAELGAELTVADGVARAARIEAMRRIARVASRDVEITAQLDQAAATAFATLKAAGASPAEFVALARDHPRTQAAVDAVLAASAALGPSQSLRALGSVLADLLVPPARVELVDRILESKARPIEDASVERNVRTRIAELLVASGLARPELADRSERLAKVGTVPGLGTDVRGRLVRLTEGALRTRRTDLALVVADGSLQRLALDTLKSMWRLRLDDRDPVILHAGERIVLWQSIAIGSEGVLVIDPETGVVEFASPRADEIWAGGAPKEDGGALGTPDGGAFLASQVLPFCDGESTVLVRRNGDLARYPLRAAQAPPQLARGTLSQVFAASVGDGLVALGGRGSIRGELRPMVKVVDARTLEERCAFEPVSREDVRWVFATAIGEIFLGTVSGVERWLVNADGTPMPMLATRGPECFDALSPKLLGPGLVVLDRADRPIRIPLYEGGVEVLAAAESTDKTPPTLRGLIPVREGLVVHTDARVVLRGHSGEVIGMDLIAGDLNLAFALPAEPGLFVLNGTGGRQVLGADAGTFRIDFPYSVQLLSTRLGLRMQADPFELTCPSQRADRALIVDGWLLLSSSQGIAAVAMPVAAEARRESQ